MWYEKNDTSRMSVDRILLFGGYWPIYELNSVRVHLNIRTRIYVTSNVESYIKLTLYTVVRFYVMLTVNIYR